MWVSQKCGDTWIRARQQGCSMHSHTRSYRMRQSTQMSVSAVEDKGHSADRHGSTARKDRTQNMWKAFLLMTILLLHLVWCAGLSQQLCWQRRWEGERAHVPKTLRATKNVPTMSRPLMI